MIRPRAKQRQFEAEIYDEMRGLGFPRRGRGRIYVQKIEDIEKVIDIILEIDAQEYKYLPEWLITTVDRYPELVYTHKFDDIPMEYLTAKCWAAGVPIWCVCEGEYTA